MKQKSPQWFEERSKRLTASDFGSAAAVKGAYKSRAALWRLKTKREWTEPNAYMAFGNEAEPVARHRYEVVSGLLVNECGLFIHPDYDWLGASPDGVIDSVGLLEIKCRVGEPHDTIPEQFIAQIQGQLACAAVERCHLMSWSPSGFRIWNIMRSSEYWEWLYPHLEDFWGWVMADREPPRLPKRRRFEGEIEMSVIAEGT